VIESDPTLSRLHFSLSHDGAQCRLRDLGSTAGTLLNDRLVKDAIVKDGDVIEAGSTRFIVRIDFQATNPGTVLSPASGDPFDLDRDGPVTEQIPIFDEDSLHDRVLKQLRSQKEPLFAILDAARDPLILARLMSCQEQYQSLYEGTKGESLAESAPYLVSLPPRSPFLEMLVREGWGNSWGVYLTSLEPFDEVRKHLRRFLTVKTEEGKELLFRYYDPRVLRVFLPTCNPAELKQFFGPIRCFWMEDGDPSNQHDFKFDGRLLQKRVSPLMSLNS
jgi:pSer/pThr/pTyr-binding forkhead associated (FHA) protein